MRPPPRAPWYLKWLIAVPAGLGFVAPLGALAEWSGRRAAGRDLREGRPPADPAQLATRRNRSLRTVLVGGLVGVGGGLAALAVAPVSVPAAVAVGVAAAVAGTAGVTTGAVRGLHSNGHLRRLRELAAQGRLGPPRQPQAQGLGRGREFQGPDMMAGHVQFFQTGLGAVRDLAAMGFAVRGRATSEFTHETTVTGPDGRPQHQRAHWAGSMNFSTGFPGPAGNPRGAGPPRPGGRPHGAGQRPDLAGAPDPRPGLPAPDDHLGH